MKISIAIFAASVITLILLWMFTDLAAQYEANGCVTTGRYTHCEKR